jgi:hypothetical protein
MTDSGIQPVTANAYLGAWGIVEALASGADFVVCPRVTDASLVVGPAAWHFAWSRTDWDRLAGAVVAGHAIECGAQVTGGNYSFFTEVPGIEHLGFPIAEIYEDGSSVITKHRHRPAALRNPRGPLPEPRRRRAFRHHSAGAGSPRPGPCHGDKG